MRYVSFWDITQRIVVNPYRHFGTTFRSQKSADHTALLITSSSEIISSYCNNTQQKKNCNRVNNYKLKQRMAVGCPVSSLVAAIFSQYYENFYVKHYSKRSPLSVIADT